MRLAGPTPRSRSFVSQVLLPFLVLFAMVLAVEGIVAYLGSKNAIRGSVLQQLETIVELRIQELGRYLDEKKDLVEFLSYVEGSNIHEAAITEGSGVAAYGKSASDTLSRFSYWTSHADGILSLSLIDSANDVLVVTAGESNPALESTYRMREPGNGVRMDLIRSNDTSDGFIEIAAPVHGTGDYASPDGMIIARIDLKYVTDFLSAETDGQAGIETTVVDGSGTPLVAAPGTGNGSTGPVRSHEAFDAFNGETGSGDYTSAGDVLMLGCYGMIEELGIGVIVEIDTDSALLSTRTIGLIFLATAVVLVILLIPTVYFVSKQIAKPILALTEVSARITEGDLSSRVQIHSSDEIGIMAQSFNDMIDRFSLLYDALQQSEERFRTLFHSSPDAVMVVTERDSAIVNANEGCLRITGYSDRELTGTRLSDVGLFIAESELSSLFHVAVSTGHAAVETRIMRRDGSFANTAVSARYVTLRDGAHLIIVIQDLTELREAQFELEKYQQGLEQLVKERTHQLENAQTELVKNEGLAVLGRLTATVSHEIRNPLGTIRNGVYSMVDAAERRDSDRLARARGLVDRNIERCDRILTELLRYAERSKPVLERMPMDGWIEASIGRMDIPDTIVLDLRKGCPEQIAIDRAQMFTAVENLVQNAVDAITGQHGEGGTISINTYVDAGKAWLRLTDTGDGVPEQDIDRLFEPLFSTKTYGVGLGLPVAQSIIEAHGGDIKIALTIDGGLEVKVSLPLAINSL